MGEYDGGEKERMERGGDMEGVLGGVSGRTLNVRTESGESGWAKGEVSGRWDRGSSVAEGEPGGFGDSVVAGSSSFLASPD